MATQTIDQGAGFAFPGVDAGAGRADFCHSVAVAGAQSCNLLAVTEGGAS